MAAPPPDGVLGRRRRRFWVVATQLGLGFEVGAAAPRTSIAKELLYAAVGLILVLPVALAGCGASAVTALAGQPADGGAGHGVLRHLPVARGVLDIYRDVFDVGIFTGSFPRALATLVGSIAAAAIYAVVERPALALKDRRTRLFASWRPVGLPTGVGR